MVYPSVWPACSVTRAASDHASRSPSHSLPLSLAHFPSPSPSQQQANMSDRASEVLANGVPPGVPKSYRALADHSGVPRSTLHYRAHGRRSIEQKAESQQYLTPSEENAVVQFLLQMSDLGQPVRIKFMPQIAVSVTRHRPAANRPHKPPGRNWARALEKRHPELKTRRVKPLDWNRHEKNTYEKITHWFEVIGKGVRGPGHPSTECVQHGRDWSYALHAVLC